MDKPKTKFETSAGGLIVSKSPKGWFILLMKDKKGEWTFPKGKIEKGEHRLETAMREIGEEVGIGGLSYRAELKPSLYWYYREGAVKKTVHYMVFESQVMQKPIVQTEEGIREAKWVRWEDAVNLIGYPKTNKPLMKEAREILHTL